MAAIGLESGSNKTKPKEKIKNNYIIKGIESYSIPFINMSKFKIIFVNYNSKLYLNKNTFINDLSNEIKKSTYGYAGFYKKKDLKKILNEYIFDFDFKGKFFSELIGPKKEISKVIIDILEKNKEYLNSKNKIAIFIFPTFSECIKKQTNGVSGFSPRKDVFHIYFNPKAKIFRTNLELSAAHEYNHAIFFENHKSRYTILENLIVEGLAINFSLKIVGKLPVFATALNLKQCREIWPKVKKILKSQKDRDYQDLFHNETKYPHWAGYSLGYLIVKDFLIGNPKISWQAIMKLTPKFIFENSNWNQTI